MEYINPHHRQEWHNSGVLDALINLNVESAVPGYSAFELLFYNDRIPRLNTTRLALWILSKYRNLEDGGWWCSGLDPLSNWEPMRWGRFKPNTPRLTTTPDNSKPVKYESPLKEPSRVTYFRVPKNVWELVSLRYNIPLPQDLIVTTEGEAVGFWHWVQQHPEIPIILTEGEKKAACLLSLGFVAIALPGIWMGTRQVKPNLFTLHPDLIPMIGKKTQNPRTFIILFDYETRPKTRQHIRTATLRLGLAIKELGAICEVALLPGPEKGIDDWVVALGKQASVAVSALITDALSLKDYRNLGFVNRYRGLHNYHPNITVNCQYLSEKIQLPRSGLVGLWSDMGTGKTELLRRWRQANPDTRFLNNGHRVNLLRNLSLRLGTNLYSDINPDNLSKITALSITVDSLYKLNENLQTYGCIFIDEACQFLAHLLQSKTCKDNQAEILDLLEYLVYNAPLVVIADAHLDDTTIDFFRAMRPESEPPFIIKNEYKSGGREIFWYDEKKSSGLVASVCAAVLAQQKVLIVSDSKRFIKKVERILKTTDSTVWVELDSQTNSPEEQDTDIATEENLVEGGEGIDALLEENSCLSSNLSTEEIVPEDILDHPEPPQLEQLRVWTIHAENSGSDENIQFIKTIRTAVKNVDVLLASPSLGTGVDIPDYHFDVIFGAFHAITQSATECAQMLWRYRPNVPTHVWVAHHPPFGFKPINANKIKQDLLESNRMTAFLIRRDRQSGERGAEKDWALEAFCRIQAQRNFSINNLQTDLKSLLEEMGNTIIPFNNSANQIAANGLKEAGTQLDQDYCLGVANSKQILKRDYLSRQSKDYLHPELLYECEKFRIWEAYGLPVTPELVSLDEGGKLISQLIALEELLADADGTMTDETTNRTYTSPPVLVKDKDKLERDMLPMCFHWRNRSSAWLARFNLGLPQIVKLLKSGVEFKGDEPILDHMKTLAIRAAPQVKAILGLTIPPNQSSMWILSQFVGQLGLKLESRKVGARGEQVRYYRLEEKSGAFAFQVLARREQQRIERERIRREELERSQRHMAWIERMGSSSRVQSTPVQSNNIEHSPPPPLSPSPHLPPPHPPVSTPPLEVGNINSCGGLDTTASMSENARFCLEFATVLETGDSSFTSVDELIEQFWEVERRELLCADELPPDYWPKVVALLAFVTDALERRLNEAVSLVLDALQYGEQTVRCVLKRWSVNQRWEVLRVLEERYSELMPFVSGILSDLPTWCCVLLS